MVDKIKATAIRLREPALKFGPMMVALSLSANQLMTNIVLASARTTGSGGSGGDAKGLAETILGIVASLIIALGLFIAVMGVVNFASAHAEGNGGSQDKAVKQIAAGVMVVALSVILKANAATLADYIETS